jgi:hypothetical protein
VDCLSIRERLAEHALSALPSDDRAVVERHLAWCAGCRKEARELSSAAADLGRSLDPVDPPGGLEDRVVEAVAVASGRRVPRRRQLMAAALVAATFVAVASLGYGTFMAGRVQQADAAAQESAERAREAAEQARENAQALRRLLAELQEARVIPSTARTVQLGPAAGGLSGGGAAVLVDNKAQHYAFVLVAGLPQGGLPYRALLLTEGGDVVAAGVIAALDPASGSIERLIDAGTSLRRVARVEVRDARGRTVLVGTVADPTPSPAVTGSAG